MGTFYHNKKDNTIIIGPAFKKGDQVRVFFERDVQNDIKPICTAITPKDGNTLDWIEGDFDICAVNIKRKRFFSFLEKWEVLEDKFS